MSGLFVKNNLKEKKLNKTNAIQKLFKPGIESDMRLFAFSSSIFSDVTPNFLKNLPFEESTGTLVKRTKFIVSTFSSPLSEFDKTRYSFSNGNKVWIDSVDNSFNLDRRGSGESSIGSKVIFNKDGSIGNIDILGRGSKYVVRDFSGNDLSGIQEVVVVLEGSESKSTSARFKFFIDNLTGKIDIQQLPELINGGTGYIKGEQLIILPQCQETESPSTSKCFNYSSGNRLFQIYSPPVAFRAFLKSKPFLYEVRDADDQGFFLYNLVENKWVYLGQEYDTTINCSGKIVLKRSDKLEVDNFLSLEKLDGNSRVFNYYNRPGEQYSITNTLSEVIDELSDNIDKITVNLGLLFQDTKKQLSPVDPTNRIGTTINIYQGLNLSTNYRIVFRDPDGVLDLPEVDFFSLQELVQSDQIELNRPSIQSTPLRIPGIWINVGGTYRRAYSTDDKPFQNIKNRKFISPMIFKLESGTNYQTGTFIERNTVGENKYSLSASYLSETGTSLVGFDTTISTLIQNLSTESQPKSGGIVYRTSVDSINIGTLPTPRAKGWELFKTSNSSKKFFILTAP